MNGKVMADEKSTSQDITNATKALNDAIASLKTKEQATKEEAEKKEAEAKASATKSANETIANANVLKEGDYTADSYKAVADAKTALEKVLADDKSTSQDITAATKALNDAIDGLKTKAEEAEEKEAAAKEAAKTSANEAIANANADDIEPMMELIGKKSN